MTRNLHSLVIYIQHLLIAVVTYTFVTIKLAQILFPDHLLEYFLLEL